MKGKNKEEEEPAHSQEDRWLGPAHFAHTGKEQQEEERKQMNGIFY